MNTTEIKAKAFRAAVDLATEGIIRPTETDSEVGHGLQGIARQQESG